VSILLMNKKKQVYEQSLVKMLHQCERIEKLYKRKLNAYIDEQFKQYDTSIDFYEEIIDNMSN